MTGSWANQVGISQSLAKTTIFGTVDSPNPKHGLVMSCPWCRFFPRNPAFLEPKSKTSTLGTWILYVSIPDLVHVRAEHDLTWSNVSVVQRGCPDPNKNNEQQLILWRKPGWNTGWLIGYEPCGKNPRNLYQGILFCHWIMADEHQKIP